MSETAGYLGARRARVAGAWGLKDEIVLVGAGRPIPIPGGADQTYPFLAHADYYYLTDREVVGGVVAFDPAEGWAEFVPPVTRAERVWEGRTDVPGRPIAELGAWLGARRGRAVVALGAAIPELAGAAPKAMAGEARTAEVAAALLHARRPKDAIELERMRVAARTTVPGYVAAHAMIREGVTERDIQVEMESAFFRHGASATAYGTIVGAGTNSAVLHFSPTSRRIRAGDVVLIDAGAAVGRYVSDVTRTWRAPGDDGGAGTEERFFHELYSLVRAVEEHAIARCTPGREWRDVHLAASLEIAEGLVALGIMKGRAEALVEMDAHALFFPHGLGHLVGLGVRDASGRAPGREPSTRPGLSSLRVDLPLELGYTITVEPGIYFIPALLQDPANRARYRDVVAWDRVDDLLDFGGIRIEDNVVITDGLPEVLTAAIPK